MNYGKHHNSLQDHFGRIEESGRVMRKLSLYFPVMNADILDELKEVNGYLHGIRRFRIRSRVHEFMEAVCFEEQSARIREDR